jgi:hypothetical protein
VGASIVGSLYADTRDLRDTSVTNATNIREVQTDIRYMRESLTRIEHAIAPKATP